MNGAFRKQAPLDSASSRRLVQEGMPHSSHITLHLNVELMDNVDHYERRKGMWMIWMRIGWELGLRVYVLLRRWEKGTSLRQIKCSWTWNFVVLVVATSNVA